jgi:hypothetical protein
VRRATVNMRAITARLGCRARFTGSSVALDGGSFEMTDPFNLKRFVTAQEPVFDTVLRSCGPAESGPTGCGSSFLN